MIEAMETEPAAALALLLDAAAHGARNDVATLRSVQQLVGDEDVREELRRAVGSLQVLVERAVTTARAALPADPPYAAIAVQELVELAARRARREGALDARRVLPVAQLAAGDVRVPGAWCERVLADLVHCAADGARFSVARGADHEVVVELTVEVGRWSELEEYATAVLVRCGASCARNGNVVRVVLPRA